VSAWQFRYKLEGRSQTLTIGKLADIALRDVWSGVATSHRLEPVAAVDRSENAGG
jgi:hypothetical protein